MIVRSFEVVNHGKSIKWRLSRRIGPVKGPVHGTIETDVISTLSDRVVAG